MNVVIGLRNKKLRTRMRYWLSRGIHSSRPPHTATYINRPKLTAERNQTFSPIPPKYYGGFCLFRTFLQGFQEIQSKIFKTTERKRE